MRNSRTNAVDDCVSMSADATDFVVPAHVMEHEDTRYFVVPSSDLLIGTLDTPDGAEVPIIIQLNAGFGTGLAQAMSIDAMRSLAGRMFRIADTMEHAAMAAADAALDRARKGDR